MDLQMIYANAEIPTEQRTEDQHKHPKTNWKLPKRKTYSIAEEGLSFCSYKDTKTASLFHTLQHNINRTHQRIKFSFKTPSSEKSNSKKRLETFGERIDDSARFQVLPKRFLLGFFFLKHDKCRLKDRVFESRNARKLQMGVLPISGCRLAQERKGNIEGAEMEKKTEADPPLCIASFPCGSLLSLSRSRSWFGGDQLKCTSV